ncbi:MAG: hypothetical protein CME24_15625 [Gemmatimonadetes bacterium]|nr:hypothetical protein [Gemmatimonadota bacterium]
MKIFDCEAYLPNSGNPYLCGDSFEAADLIRMLDEVDTEAVLTIPAPEAPLEGSGWEQTNNRTMHTAMAEYPGKILGCCVVNPADGDAAVDEFEKTVKEWGFSGLKYSPGLEGTAADLAKAAAEMEIPVTIHTNGSVDAYERIAGLAKRHPELVMVLEHMGYRFHVDLAIDLARRFENIYLAPTVTAAAEPMVVKKAVEEVGAERMVFGSNAPWAAPVFGVEAIRRLRLGDAQEHLIFRGNFQRIYRLE